MKIVPENLCLQKIKSREFQNLKEKFHWRILLSAKMSTVTTMKDPMKKGYICKATQRETAKKIMNLVKSVA